MKIASGRSLLALTAAGLVLFLVYAFVVAASLELAIDYLGRGCAASGSGALREGSAGPAFCVEFWINRYQGLIGGILALGGAYLAFSAVRQQIAQVERHESERRERESNAARSAVPHALSKLNSYASGCVEALRACRPPQGQALTIGQLSPPEFPEEIIPILQNAVRYSDPGIAAQFADLIAQSQIQHSRIADSVRRSIRQPSGNLSYIELQDRIYDGIDLYVRSAMLFDYGRHFLNRYLVTAENLRGSRLILNLDHQDWPHLSHRIDILEAAQRARANP